MQPAAGAAVAGGRGHLPRRAGGTPVGIVTEAGLAQQVQVATDLEHVLEQEIGMRSMLIIGNSGTRMLDGRMVTLRGYAL